MVEEWLLPRLEDASAPPDGYIVSFIPFHEGRLAMPTHCFFHGLLHYYGIKLRHLTPNGIQHITVFIAMCEGYLGIEPHFELWWYLFYVTVNKRKNMVFPMGCTNIHLRRDRTVDYLDVDIVSSHKGWHLQWLKRPRLSPRGEQ